MRNMAQRNSSRVIENLSKHLSGLQQQRALLRNLTSASSQNPLLEDWTATEPFGLPPFSRIEPSHFKPAFDEAMAQHLAEFTAGETEGLEPHIFLFGDWMQGTKRYEGGRVGCRVPK